LLPHVPARTLRLSIIAQSPRLPDRIHEDRGVKNESNDRILLAASILIVSPGVNAGTVFVAEVPAVQTWPNGAAILEFRHGDNPSRAWVSATLCGRFIAGNSENSDCRIYNQHDFHV
jgi:hypothetical protein